MTASDVYALGTAHAPGVVPLPEPTAADLAPYLPMLAEHVHAFMAARHGENFDAPLHRLLAAPAPSLLPWAAQHVPAASPALVGARTTRGPDATAYADATGAGVAA